MSSNKLIQENAKKIKKKILGCDIIIDEMANLSDEQLEIIQKAINKKMIVMNGRMAGKQYMFAYAEKKKEKKGFVFR